MSTSSINCWCFRLVASELNGVTVSELRRIGDIRDRGLGRIRKGLSAAVGIAGRSSGRGLIAPDFSMFSGGAGGFS